MAAQAFYRKWRSQTFSDLVGQEPIVHTLKNGLHSGRIAHAYLFCGPRGTGKTSSARLLAKTVNCQNPQNGEPCTLCPNCREITEGRSLDVIEIDAASNRGIDEIRDLRDKIAFNPGNSKYKVYILDEVHMLTEGAFNALLKTLEEPPPHAIFVLATTEANRVPATIISRCQRFDFKRISVRDIISHLHYVAEQEGIQLEPPAADLLARAASGGMRDALSLLDQSVAALGATVTLDGVQQMLGLADPRLVRELVEHIAYLRGAEGLHLINRLAEAGADLRQLSAQVAEYWRALLLAKAGADVVVVLDRAPEDAAEITQLAGLFALEELSSCARIFSQNDVGARSISIPQLAVELAFIDCLHLHRQRANGGPADTTLRSQPVIPAARPAVASPLPPAAPAPEMRRASAPILGAPPAPSQRPALPPDLAGALGEASAPLGASAPPPPALTSAAQAESAADAASFALEDEEMLPAASALALSLDDVQGKWELVKKVCKKKSPKLAALLNNALPIAVGETDTPELVIRVEHDFHHEWLIKPESRAIIEWALKEILEVSYRLTFLKNGEAPPPLSPARTPADFPQRQSSAPRPPVPAPPPPAEYQVPSAAPPTEQASRPRNSAPADKPGIRESPAPPWQNGHAPMQPAAQPPADPLEQIVRRDPVVQEVIEYYGARLVEWKPVEE